MAELRRALGLLDATMVNVGVMIGSAVFLAASDVARAFPNPALQLGTAVLQPALQLGTAVLQPPPTGRRCILIAGAWAAFR